MTSNKAGSHGDEDMSGKTTQTRAPIQVLPVDVSSRIAAGEVVERPASVVKELVENALDAGASRIRVDIHRGGLSLIRVGDDGSGIPAAELHLACRRHATSKLADADLSQVRTLGFRGEALPSIAAVAELTLLSAVDDSGLGRRLTLLDGRIVVDEPGPRLRGTTVTVRHLFQNVPARLALADRVQAEVAQIGQLVRRLALAQPDVRLILFIDDRLVLQTSGSGDLATALVEVYGAKLAGNLLSFGPADIAGGARISGVVSTPEVTRSGRSQVNVVVNGRWVQPRGLLAMLEASYRPVLPRGRHPVLTLAIETAPDQVDINIHPAKLDVRLLAERAIGSAAGELIADALGRQPRLFQFDIVLDHTHPRPLMIGEDRAAWDDDDPIVTPNLPPLSLLGQVQARLLVAEGPDGLLFIDQHRAHERILYERVLAAYGGTQQPVTLVEPLLLDIHPAQLARFKQRLQDLATFGFELDLFGERIIRLRAAPELPGVLSLPASDRLHGLGELDELVAAILAVADELPSEGEDWRERALIQLACRSALRRGRSLDRPAMRALVQQLGHTRAPAICPHGSPILMHVSGSQIQRQFGWR